MIQKPMEGPAVRLRTVALPLEHGGWSMLGMPILLGLWVAFSWAGFALGVAAFGAFLTRQPLKLLLSDYRRGKRYPRTGWALGFAAFYGGVALLAFVTALLVTAHPFWLPLLPAIPLALIQLRYDMRQQSRTTIAELAGATALGSLAPAIALAGGAPLQPALILWLLVAVHECCAILYVAVRLKLARNAPAAQAPVYISHVGALALVGGLVAFGLAPALSIVAFTLLVMRAWLGLRPQSRHLRAALVGGQEVIFSLITVVCLAL